MPSVESEPAEQLTLFDLGGPDMSKLRLQVAKLLDRARAPATKRAYRIGWLDFERWCGKAGREPLRAWLHVRGRQPGPLFARVDGADRA